MITLDSKTANLIKDEMERIPEKYQKPFNSTHEGLGVLREEEGRTYHHDLNTGVLLDFIPGSERDLIEEKEEVTVWVNVWKHNDNTFYLRVFETPLDSEGDIVDTQECSPSLKLFARFSYTAKEGEGI